jgi:hypothetical protein
MPEDFSDQKISLKPSIAKNQPAKMMANMLHDAINPPPKVSVISDELRKTAPEVARARAALEIAPREIHNSERTARLILSDIDSSSPFSRNKIAVPAVTATLTPIGF